MTLRIATSNDASSIAALSIEVWLSTYLRRGVSAFFADFVLSEFTVPKTEALISDPNTFILVSDNEEGIDGFIHVAFDRPGPVEGCSNTEISTFYIQPGHHGRGLGKRLLTGALQHCREMGIMSVWLATNAENAPAIAFYLSQGFQQIGHSQFHLKDQSYLNNVYALDLK